MVSDKLLEKILIRTGATKEIRLAASKEQYRLLNERLDKQMKDQRMTQEILNKVIDL